MSKPKYRLKSANDHNLVFEKVGGGPADPLYLVSRTTWARWMRGDWP